MISIDQVTIWKIKDTILWISPEEIVIDPIDCSKKVIRLG